MKKNFLKIVLIVCMIFSLTACGDSGSGHDGEAKTPSGSRAQKGRDYQDVELSFKEAGFTNVKSVPMGDLITGFLNKEGEVDSVTVDGDEEYSADSWVSADVEVIINYHSFPEDTETSEPEEENSNSVKTTEEDGTEESSEKVESITIENNEDFATVLKATDEFDSSYGIFAENNAGKIIEFDACITNVMNHGDYDTRYDILLSAGDYVDENTANPGPIFKFTDVNTSNLGIHDLYLPPYISTGNNIHVIAKIDKFDEAHGVFLLKPISVTER